MSPWIPLIGFAVWTCGVAFYADRYGYGRAEEACQAERDRAEAAKDEREAQHAARARHFEEEARNDRDFIAQLQARVRGLSRTHPIACRVGAERLHLWNEANLGRAVSGEPAREVPD